MSCYNNYVSRNCCGSSGEYGTYVTIQGPAGPMEPEGPRGEQGIRGEQGPMGPRGLKDEAGCPGPAGPRGAVEPVGPRVPQGVQGDMGCQGPQGEKGEQGPQGEKGDTGEKGEQGIQGPEGETPTVSVAENTPISYKLNFKTTEQDITTPNLFAPYTAYHADISATNSVLSVPIGELILSYQNISTTSVRISIAPKTADVPILADMRRTSIYNGGTVEAQSFDNTTVSSRTVLDDIVYSKSQETHSIEIRQQDPQTKLWSLCEVTTFISASGARTSVLVRFSEYYVAYTAPATE